MARARGERQPEGDHALLDQRFRIGAAPRLAAAYDLNEIETRIGAALDACSCGGCPTRSHSNVDCPLRAVQELGW